MHGTAPNDRSMRVGIVLPIAETDGGPNGIMSYEAIRAVAIAADRTGFDSIWVFDHLLFRFGGKTTGIHECWTILAAVAEATSRVELGTIVMCTGFRNPALLAKMAATLDEVSGGRLILGLGCGSHPPEYAAFGYPYDHRVSRFEEALGILVPLLRAGRVDFAGRYHAARDCELTPRGPRPGGPPIWIAGFQPRMTTLAARWGDAFVTAWHPGPAALAEPFARIEAACADVGRDPATLGRAVGVIVSLPEAG